MKALVLREFQSVFSSATGIFFSLVFLIAVGLLLWTFPGSYNLIDTGYADMRPFFRLTASLLMILIPALTMRLFAEEKRNKTLEVLLSRPVKVSSIYISKFLATYIFIFVTLIPTVLFVWSLSALANPVGNIDQGAIMASYVSLLLLVALFVSIGLFSSVVTNNQMVAYVLSLILSFFLFYGFELLAGFFSTGKTQVTLSFLGIYYHYESMQRGVVGFDNLSLIIIYSLFFYLMSIFYLNRKFTRTVFVCVILLHILVFFVSFLPAFKFDFTADKRYTLSDYTKRQLSGLKSKQSVKIDLYLGGDLNYGFEQLKNSVIYLISHFNTYANGDIILSNIDAYTSDLSYKYMVSRGMPGIMLNEMNREGKLTKKMIYPYAQVSDGVDTLTISLLKHTKGYSAEENLNASIENLEFEFIDAIRLLNQKETKQVAFIEGHGELPRTHVYDAEELLSKYYNINRGQTSNDPGVLNDFDVVIIAGPLEKYNDTEKYILDQYIMRGGRVLWFIDGTYYSHRQLMEKGASPSIKNDHNLDDMLFTYGVRINADVIQDKQCVNTYLITDDETKSSTLFPNYFQPLLMPSMKHPVTKDIQDVKAGFASSIDIVNNSPDIKKVILLTSSMDAHLIKAPDVIDFDIERIQDDSNYFNESFLSVAVSLEGEFTSSFINRPIPDSIIHNKDARIDKSKKTKMIVVSSSEIISNEIQEYNGETQIVPMGYDRVSQQQFGNRDFIVNAVNWLTDDDGLMELRTKKQKIYLLNRNIAYEKRDFYAVLNIGFPVLFMLIILGTIWIFRKRKYEK